jgi:hypothetical protein
MIQRVEKLRGASIRVADQGVLTSFERPFRGVWAACTRIDALRIDFFNTLVSPYSDTSRENAPMR